MNLTKLRAFPSREYDCRRLILDLENFFIRTLNQRNLPERFEIGKNKERLVLFYSFPLSILLKIQLLSSPYFLFAQDVPSSFIT